MKIDKINSILNNTKEYIKNPEKFNFEDIALDLYDLHRLHNKNYKKYSIGKLDNWHKIPLVPSYEFSKRKLQLNNFNGFDPTNEIEFISKGIKPKHHVLRDTEFLRTSVTNNFSLSIMNISTIPTNRIVFLSDTESNSLLSYICEYLSIINNVSGAYEYVNPLDKKVVEEFLTSPTYHVPLTLIGTPNQFYQFKLTVDSLISNPVIDTGPGLPTIIQFGDYHELSKMDLTLGELNHWLKDFFHTDINNVIQVYYNTELSSQLFRWGENLTYYVPPTISVRVIDPTTGEECEPGIEGNLAFIDVANVWSCPFIISDDLGIQYSNSTVVQITRRSDEIIKTGIKPK
jgi:hypothetical protein